jgi:hypothetical protein
MMLGIFDYWLVWVLPFLAFTGIGLLIYALGSRTRKPRPAPGKYDTYTCGEEFPVTDVGQENFYRPIKSVLELSRLRRAHTGRLSDYLLMILAGAALVIVMVMVL